MDRNCRSIKLLANCHTNSVLQKAALMIPKIKLVKPVVDNIIPWLKSAEIAYFDEQVIVFITDIPELLSKTYIRKQDIVNSLLKSPYFSKLKDLHIFYSRVK